MVHQRAVYTSVHVRTLPAPARAALEDGLHAALFFSAETARSFVAAIRRAGLAPMPAYREQPIQSAPKKKAQERAKAAG